MAPRFDPDRSTLELAVADLLEAALSRSLGFAQRGGFERLWLGQAIHSRYQERTMAEDGTYRREIALAATFPHRGWEVTVHGRADGLRRESDGFLVVEEIKSLRRGGQLAAATRQVFEQQALLYAWLLRRQGEARVRAELVLIEIGGDQVEREVLEADLDAIERRVRGRLDALLGAFEAERAALERRRDAAATLAFPYSEPRPGQEAIAAAVETALRQGDHLLLEAATGLGKTVAALWPALRYALAHDKRIFVLTAKTLQQEMAGQVLELLNPGGVAHSVRLRAKAKMCAHEEVLCHEEYCPYARDYYAKLQSSRLVPRLRAAFGNLLPDDIFAAARQAEVCPFEVSLELAGRSQVVVCDYNYAFDRYVALSDFAPDADLDDAILVIDEIHNLVERGRGYLSPQLSARAARAAAAGAGATRIHRQLAGLAADLAALIESSVAAGLEDLPPEARAAETSLPEDELWSLRPDFDEAFVAYLEHQRATRSFRADDAFVNLYFELLRFLDGLMIAGRDPAFSRLVADRDEDGPRLKLLCKDPGRHLGAVFSRVHSAIGLSATLSPPEFYRDLLGLEPARTATLTVPHPFPPSRRRVVIDASVATTWRERPEHYPRIAEQVAAFAGEVPGNCLVLFPSYQFLAEVAGRLKIPGKRLLVQGRADSDREREAILATLRGAWLGDVVLLAVAGGVFAEGVDYPGEMLKAVAVVGPCLPAVSLEQELLKSYYQERFERGFEYAFVVPGMTRVVQAAGRLIRSPADTGVIALLDRRFLARPYREHLPGHWLDGGSPEALTGDPAEAAREFFRAGLAGSP